MAIRLFKHNEDAYNSALKMLNTNGKAAQKYYIEHGDLRVPITEDRYDGVDFGGWISQLRNYRKSGTHTAALTPKRISDLDKIGTIWNVSKYKRYRN